MKEQCRCNESPTWRVSRGCGHSYHITCLIPNISSCPKCTHAVQLEMKTLAKKATEAVYHIDQNHEFDYDYGCSDLKVDDLTTSVLSCPTESDRIEHLIQQIWTWRRPSIPLTWTAFSFQLLVVESI